MADSKALEGELIEPEAFKRKTGEGFKEKLKKGRGQVADSATDDEEFSDELIEQCRDVGIKNNAIKAGGDYRQLSKGKIYWLPLDKLLEFELKDQDTVDDGEFFDWFAGYVLLHDFQTKSERTQKSYKSWDTWKPNWEWDKPKKIGSWWSSWGYSSYGDSGTELTKKLAIALKAITTTVSVVNDTGKRYRVRLAQDDPNAPKSYTSYNEQLIVVSPQALLDTSMAQDDSIEITTGFGLHEASHVKYSESLLEALTKPTELRPKSVAHLLHNILEDLRIETLTGEKFPGFADFFVTANDYMYEATKEFSPTTWGPKLQDKLNGVISMTKHPAKFEPIAMADPGLAVEWPWWREWAEDYVANKEPIRSGVIRGLERLAEDPQTKQEMEDLTKEEEALEKLQGTPLNDKQFKELLDKLKELLDAGGKVGDPCPSPGGNDDPNDPTAGSSTGMTLTEEQAEQLEQLINEQYQEFEAFYKMKDGGINVGPMIEVRRPMEDDRSRQMYQRAGGMADRLREVFYFRKVAPTEAERLLKTGFIDEEQLWRVGTGDTRVFERSAEPEETFTSVTMLVDISGSMVGEGLEKAQELANVMLACLRTQRGVRVRVRGHSTGRDYSSDGQSCNIYRIWEPGDPDSRIGLLKASPHGSNFDGFAIDWCAKEMNDTAQPTEQQLLIVLSDGLPAGTIVDNGHKAHYGGGPAMDHMKQLGDYWDRQGVKIVQIAIDQDGLRPEDQARMFKNWIGYESDPKLLVDLTKLLTKTFGGVE